MGLGEKGKSRGGFGKNSIFFPLARIRTGGASGGRPAGVPAGGPGHGRGWGMGKNGEGDEGILSPCSPWTEAARGGGSAAAADRWCWPTVVARCGCAARQWRVAVAWWCGEETVLPFYRRPKAVRGEDIFQREAAGELVLLLEVRPATGDATARAAAGQHVQES
jgi:hypothetical protein